MIIFTIKHMRNVFKSWYLLENTIRILLDPNIENPNKDPIFIFSHIYFLNISAIVDII